MPERSKGLDSSSSVFVLVGSSPTECKFDFDHILFTLCRLTSQRPSHCMQRRNSPPLCLCHHFQMWHDVTIKIYCHNA